MIVSPTFLSVSSRVTWVSLLITRDLQVRECSRHSAPEVADWRVHDYFEILFYGRSGWRHRVLQVSRNLMFLLRLVYTVVMLIFLISTQHWNFRLTPEMLGLV